MSRFQPPEFVEVETYAMKIGLSVLEASKFYDYFSSNGWLVGGRAKMKDWQAAMRNWKRNWEERRNPGSNGQLSGADKIILQKEYERIETRMATIRGQYGDHQTWDEADKLQFKKLKARRDEIRIKLGIII